MKNFSKNKPFTISFFLLIISLINSNSCFAQKNILKSYEDSLFTICNKLYNNSSYSEKLKLNKIFLKKLEPVLDNPKSIKYPFEKLNNISILNSDDKKVRVINWIFKKDEEKFMYNAIIQYYNFENKYNVAYLKNIYPKNDLDTLKLKNNNWLGALYYQIERIKINNKTSYILLGWNGNDKKSNKKIIEVLNIDKNISFGLPIFKINNNLQNRFIIEYKENANATIKFNTKEKRILFSNLIPINDSFKGYYDYYVPDGSINAFNFIDEKFIFEENVKTIEKMNIPNKENIKKGLFPK